MKRSFLVALMIGVLAAAIFLALQVTGLLGPLERAVSNLVSHYGAPLSSAGIVWQSAVTVLLAVAVSWLTLASLRRGRIGWVVLILLFELAGLAWICALYRVLFQPLAAMGAVVLAYAAVFAETCRVIPV